MLSSPQDLLVEGVPALIGHAAERRANPEIPRDIRGFWRDIAAPRTDHSRAELREPTRNRSKNPGQIWGKVRASSGRAPIWALFFAREIGMNFAPVRTLDELDSLDIDEMVAGHLSAERGDPEPGPNRGRAFWHGWRTRMMDLGEIEIDADHRALVAAFVKRGIL